MNTDIYLNHAKRPKVSLTSFADQDDPWYAVYFSQDGTRVTLFIGIDTMHDLIRQVEISDFETNGATGEATEVAPDKVLEPAKKYELIATDKKNIYGSKLSSFGPVAAGDLGGYVESEANLSHAGAAWVSGDAEVGGNALVSGAAWVSGDAEVRGSAQVYGDAWVGGSARVSGNAQVYGSAQVSGNARVYGDAQVSGDAEVGGNALVSEGVTK
jgi:hypothetical protein